MKKAKNFLFKHWLLVFCLIIIIIQFSQIIFFNRSLFLEKYDSSYWKDRYDHSQYVLPLSRRIIGDDGLYSYAGYRLINGESIEKTSTFKPPVGIYLLGFSILLFNNPLIIELLIGMFVLISFFFLSLEVLKDKKLAIMITALLALDPFIFSNFTIGLLDLPQLLFLLLHLLFFLYAVKNTKYSVVFAVISGISLGFFTETKLPLLLPVIIFLELLYLFKQKLLFRFFWIIIGFAFGILLPYLRYFELGNSLKDFFKLHKYMLSYYASGENQLFPLSIWQSLLIGYFPNVNTGQLTKIANWSPVLPVVTVTGLFYSIKILFQKKQTLFLKGLVILTFSFLITYTLIPSYARYLTLVIPFLYIFCAIALKKYINKITFIIGFIIISLFGLFYSSFLLIPSPNKAIESFKYSFSHQYFQDIYQENLLKTDQESFTKDEFRNISQKALINATVKDISFKETSRSIPFWGNTGWVKFKVTYITSDLGSFSQDKTLSLNTENGAWKIKWDWDLLFNSFKPGDNFKVNVISGKRGTIYDNKGNVLAKDLGSIVISINPEKIDTKKEAEMLKLLQSITAKAGVDFQNAYLENPLPNSYISVATPFIDLSYEKLQELNSYKGVKLDTHIARIYKEPEQLRQFAITNTSFSECCSRIYSSSNYHGLDGMEKKYDETLGGYNGGTLEMIDENGVVLKTLIDRKPKNGKDVTLF